MGSNPTGGTIIKQCRKCATEYEPYGQKANLCKPCKRAYDRQFHKNRSPEAKAKKILQQEVSKDKVRQYVYDYLKSNPCVICGESRVPCLQFDHLRDKVDTISNMMSNKSIKSVQKEIDKCRVLCANCHAIHTAEQFNWYSRLTK